MSLENAQGRNITKAKSKIIRRRFSILSLLGVFLGLLRKRTLLPLEVAMNLYELLRATSQGV